MTTTYHYIKIENNQPVGRALTAGDILKIFPEHDLSTGAPAGYAELVETPRPKLPRWHKIVVTGFTNLNGKWYDNIEVQPMTPSEKEIAINGIKLTYYQKTGYNSWTYNPDLDIFEPPFQPVDPVANGVYEWNETTQSWTLLGIRE